MSRGTGEKKFGGNGSGSLIMPKNGKNLFRIQLWKNLATISIEATMKYQYPPAGPAYTGVGKNARLISTSSRLTNRLSITMGANLMRDVYVGCVGT